MSSVARPGSDEEQLALLLDLDADPQEETTKAQTTTRLRAPSSELAELAVAGLPHYRTPLSVFITFSVFVWLTSWALVFYGALLLTLYRVLLLVKPEERFDAERRVVGISRNKRVSCPALSLQVMLAVAAFLSGLYYVCTHVITLW